MGTVSEFPRAQKKIGKQLFDVTLELGGGVEVFLGGNIDIEAIWGGLEVTQTSLSKNLEAANISECN